MKICINFINSVTRGTIKSFNDVLEQQALLLIPSDGFVVLDTDKYKVSQIIKTIDTHQVSFVRRDDNIGLIVNVYVTKINGRDYWLGTF